MSLFGLFGPPNIERLKAKGDIKGLIKALYYKKDNKIRKRATEALKEIGTPAVEQLIKTLKAPELPFGFSEENSRVLMTTNSTIREAAAWALGEIGNPLAVDPLVTAFKYLLETDEVREAAAEALIKIGGNDTLEQIMDRIASSSFNTRKIVTKALKALEQTGDQHTVKMLVTKIKDLSAFTNNAKGNFDTEIWYQQQVLANTLEAILKRIAVDMEQTDLKRIAYLKDVTFVWKLDKRDPWTDEWYVEKTNLTFINCSNVRQIAQQELIRRGMKPDSFY